MKVTAGTGTRTRRSRRRWIIPAAIAGVLSVLVLVGLLVIYPRYGAKKVRSKGTVLLSSKLGRDVRFGAVEVKLGHASIKDVEIRGPNDGELPLVYIESVE